RPPEAPARRPGWPPGPTRARAAVRHGRCPRNAARPSSPPAARRWGRGRSPPRGTGGGSSRSQPAAAAAAAATPLSASSRGFPC
ncbi:unnamed protein product, partial [Prorocentrum cordatum]